MSEPTTRFDAFEEIARDRPVRTGHELSGLGQDELPVNYSLTYGRGEVARLGTPDDLRRARESLSASQETI